MLPLSNNLFPGRVFYSEAMKGEGLRIAGSGLQIAGSGLQVAGSGLQIAGSGKCATKCKQPKARPMPIMHQAKPPPPAARLRAIMAK